MNERRICILFGLLWLLVAFHLDGLLAAVTIVFALIEFAEAIVRGVAEWIALARRSRGRGGAQA